MAQGAGSIRKPDVKVSLRVKAMAGTAVLVFLSATVIGLAVLSVSREEMRGAFETRIDVALEATAQGIAPALVPSPDIDEIARLVQGPVRNNGVVFCACYGHDGTLLGFSGLPEFSEPLHKSLSKLGPMLPQLADPSATAPEMTTRRGDRVSLRSASVVMRVTEAKWREIQARSKGSHAAGGESASEPTSAHGGQLQDRAVGTVVLGHTWLPLEAEYAAISDRVWSIVFGVGAATALIAWLVARLIVRPILALVAGTQRLARGDFEQRVEVRTRDELALLATSFNSMTSELKTARESLARQNEVLEETVRARTRKLAEAYEELKTLDRMKDGFLSSISHEFRTPITSIRAFAEILQQDPTIDAATRQEFAGIIAREAEQMESLVSDVLDLVKIESGQMPFRFARQKPAELARAAIEQVAPLSLQKDVTIDLVAAIDLPETLWDGAKVTRLLTALLENAVQFSPSAGRVELSLAAVDDRIRIDVRDRGPGIPADQLEAVFEKFHQAGDVLTGKPQGQGLGLPICRLISRRHGGEIRAVPSDCGAHLVVHLPVTPPARQPAASSALPGIAEPLVEIGAAAAVQSIGS